MTLGVWVLQSFLECEDRSDQPFPPPGGQLGSSEASFWALRADPGQAVPVGPAATAHPCSGSGVNHEPLSGSCRDVKGPQPAGALGRTAPRTCSLPSRSFTVCVGQQSAKSLGKPGQIFWECFIYMAPSFPWVPCFANSSGSTSAKLLGHKSQPGCGRLPTSCSEAAAWGRRPGGWKPREASPLGNPCPHCSRGLSSWEPLSSPLARPLLSGTPVLTAREASPRGNPRPHPSQGLSSWEPLSSPLARPLLLGTPLLTAHKASPLGNPHPHRCAPGSGSTTFPLPGFLVCFIAVRHALYSLLLQGQRWEASSV